MKGSSGYGLMASIEGSRLPPPMLEFAATLARSSGVRTVLWVNCDITEMVVIEQWFRNRWEARFHLSMGRFSYPRGKHRAQSMCCGCLTVVRRPGADWPAAQAEFTIRMTATRKHPCPAPAAAAARPKP